MEKESDDITESCDYDETKEVHHKKRSRSPSPEKKEEFDDDHSKREQSPNPISPISDDEKSNRRFKKEKLANSKESVKEDEDQEEYGFSEDPSNDRSPRSKRMIDLRPLEEREYEQSQHYPYNHQYNFRGRPYGYRGGYRNNSWNNNNRGRPPMPPHQHPRMMYEQSLQERDLKLLEREEKSRASQRRLDRLWDDFRQKSKEFEEMITKEKAELRRMYALLKDHYADVQKMVNDSVFSRRDH